MHVQQTTDWQIEFRIADGDGAERRSRLQARGHACQPPYGAYFCLLIDRAQVILMKVSRIRSNCPFSISEVVHPIYNAVTVLVPACKRHCFRDIHQLVLRIIDS
jgi:hypothetical protein